MFGSWYGIPGAGWYITSVFFGADGETEVIAGRGECVHLLLHLLLVVGIEGTVLSREEISDHSLLDFGDSLKTSDVEESPITPVIGLCPCPHAIQFDVLGDAADAFRETSPGIPINSIDRLNTMPQSKD